MSVVYTNPPRAEAAIVAGFGALGLATVHEAQGRVGRGALGLDLYSMRDRLARVGLTYKPYGTA